MPPSKERESSVVDKPEGLSELLASIKTLPSLPSGVGRLMALPQSDPDYFEQATAIIRSDPALAGQVIKIANSALYAGQENVETLDRAIMRVGIRMVVGSLTSGHMRRSFSPKREELQGIWVSNLMSALFCRALAERCSQLQIVPETAYTYGLLHDVGRLGLMAIFRRGMGELLESEDPHPVLTLSELERRYFGIAHQTVGRLIGSHWRFPPEITLVIAAHHLPLSKRINYPGHLQRMIDLVNLTDFMGVYLHEAGAYGEDMETWLVQRLDQGESSELLERLDLSISRTMTVVEPTLRQLHKQMSLLGLPRDLPARGLLLPS